jgi:subtilisin family serine protease
MKKIFLKGNYIVLLALLVFTVLSFKDNSDYKLLNGNVIIRQSDGAMFEKGVINLKLKTQNSNFNKKSLGIEKIDKVLEKYKIKAVIQPHPLKSDVKKRVYGDELLSMIFRIEYESNINPVNLSEIIISENKDVLDWAEPSIVYKSDYIPNDPLWNNQWHISKISSLQAWDVTRGDTNMVIGIVDSGSDFIHPDLAANMHYNYADPVNGIDDDNNGYIDDFKGWDFYGNDNDPQIAPNGNTHGSHVSGCASQVTDNGIHGAGIGFKCKLMISKHTNDTDPNSLLYYTDAGIVYCYQNGAKVINCSFGSSYYSSYTQLVCSNAWGSGSMICGSAGNNGLNTPRYPASYDYVVSSAATNSNDVKASFSNYHTTVDVSSPGQGILSTVYNNSYESWDGTSMSSPITAGTVALIRCSHPSWQPQDVLDRLLLSCDSIYNLNPSYIGLLGAGRINAFKACADKPILSLTSFNATDSLYGNNDKVFDANELIAISISVKNVWLSGNNVSIRLSTADTNVQIVNDSVYIGNIAQYGTSTIGYANGFKVKAKSNCPYDKIVTFKLTSSVTAYANDASSSFNLTFRQGFATHTVNNLKLSLTRDGAVGKKAENYGNGLFIGNGTVNNIFEGGLMIGASNTKVSDVCRKGENPPYNVSDTDFVSQQIYTLTTPGSISAQDGYGKYNDDGAGVNKIGVLVEQQSFAFTSPNDQNYILLKYNVKNTNSTVLNNIFIGVCIYFSPNSTINGNISALDTVNKLGYTYNQSNPVPYLGLAMMTGDNLNFKAINAIDMFNGFTVQEKWDALSSGISTPIIGPGGNAVVVSGGPFTIQPNTYKKIGFAVVTGNDLNELKNNTISARNKYAATIGILPVGNELPLKYQLSQNYPNPFNPMTKIKFAIPKNDFVKLNVYDVLGREISTLINEKLSAGYYEIEFNAASYSSGIYFYRIQTNNFFDVKKMLLIK